MYSNTTRSTPSEPIRPTATPSLPPQTQKAELAMGIFPSNPLDRGFIILGLVQIGVVMAIFLYCFYLFIMTGHFLGEGRRRRFLFIDDFVREFKRSRSVRLFHETYNDAQGWIKAHIPRSSGSGEKDRNDPRAYHALNGTTVDGGVMSPGLHPPETAYHSNSPHFPQSQISVSRVLRPHPRMVASPSTLSETYIANRGDSATPSHVSRIPSPSPRIYATPSPTSSPCGASFIPLPPSPWPTSMSPPRVVVLKPLPRSPMPPISPSPLPRFVSAIGRATASRASRASKSRRDSPMPLLPTGSPVPSIHAPSPRYASSRAGSERPASTISQARSMRSRARPPMTFRLSGDSEDEDLLFDFLPSDYKKEEKRIGRYDAITGRIREDDGIPKFFKDVPIASPPPRFPGVGLGVGGHFGRWGAGNRTASGHRSEGLSSDPSTVRGNSRPGVDRGSLRVDGALLSPDIARHISGRGANTDKLSSVRGSLRVDGALRSPSIARHSGYGASMDRTSTTTRQSGPGANINCTSSTTLVPSMDRASCTTTRQSERASNIDRSSIITTKQSGPVSNINRRSTSTVRQSGVALSIDGSSTATAQSGAAPSIDRASTITARSMRFDDPDPRPMYVESPRLENPFSTRGESPMPIRVEGKKFARLVGIEINDMVMRGNAGIPEEANENERTPQAKGKRKAGEGFESEHVQGKEHVYVEEHGNDYEPEHDIKHGKLEHRESKKQKHKRNQDFDFQFVENDAIRTETVQEKECGMEM